MAMIQVTNILVYVAVSAVIIGLLDTVSHSMITFSSGMKITKRTTSEQQSEIMMKLTDMKNETPHSKFIIEPQITKNIKKNRRVNFGMKEMLKNESVKIVHPRLIRSANNIKRNLEDKRCLKLKYLFIVQSGFFKNSEESNSIERYIAKVMDIMEILFDTLELNIKVSTIGIIQLTKENERYLAPYIQESYIPSHPNFLKYDTLISYMTQFYCKSKDPLALKADIIMLLVKQKLVAVNETGDLKNIGGVASSIGGICEQCEKSAILSYDEMLEYIAHGVVHETAHLLGCMHDGEGSQNSKILYNPGAENCSFRDGYIMGDINVAKWKFSSCCKRNVEHLLNMGKGDCITVTCNGD